MDNEDISWALSSSKRKLRGFAGPASQGQVVKPLKVVALNEALAAYVHRLLSQAELDHRHYVVASLRLGGRIDPRAPCDNLEAQPHEEHEMAEPRDTRRRVMVKNKETGETKFYIANPAQRTMVESMIEAKDRMDASHSFDLKKIRKNAGFDEDEE